MIEKSRKIIGLGHPRCGTGFTSYLLSAAGLKIGHERRHADGNVSWLSVSERSVTPWGNGHHRPLKDTDYVFCAVRSMVAAIPSVMAENRVEGSLKFRRDILMNYYGIDITNGKDVPQNEISVALAGMTLWYELCLTKKPEFIFRIDRPEDDEKLNHHFNIEVSRSSISKRNSRPKLKQDINFSHEMLDIVSVRWLKRSAELSRKIGYDNDASTFLDVLK
ncbi:MAG: hypothetical protein ABJN34_07690 [Litoreibacter sp.]|uniref:hypothetical protein n=1 Tax=Litoreibacter sp. TaxID=1969459 RepID=UPI0032995560